MDLRRGLRAVLVALALLLAFGPSQALAAPQWLPAELREAAGSGAPADVASDANGNSVAVWLGPSGTVEAAYRPARRALGAVGQTSIPVPRSRATPPLVTAEPDGQFVAVWLADRPVGEFEPYPLRWARRPAGGDWSAPATITRHRLLPGHQRARGERRRQRDRRQDGRGRVRPRTPSRPAARPGGRTSTSRPGRAAASPSVRTAARSRSPRDSCSEVNCLVCRLSGRPAARGADDAEAARVVGGHRSPA